MDFNYKLAIKNVESFKRDFAKGLIIDELPPIGKGTNQEVFSYKNLVIKRPMKALEDEALDRKYHELLVESSERGIKDKLKFAPILGYVKSGDKFCTISPFINGTELPDCTNEQMLDLGVDGLKKYFKNNLQLRSIHLSPEFHDVYNFKLSEKGNINVVDYSTWYYPSFVDMGRSIEPFEIDRDERERMRELSARMISVCKFDERVHENLFEASKQP